MVDVISLNRAAWDAQVSRKNRWTVPVTSAAIEAGFVLTGFYEDTYPPGEDRLSEFIPTFIATRAQRRGGETPRQGNFEPRRN